MDKFLSVDVVEILGFEGNVVQPVGIKKISHTLLCFVFEQP